MRVAKFKIQAALGDASVDMLSDMGSIPITFTKKKKKGTVALTIFLVNRQSLSHGIENSQPLSISAQEQIMIFGQHKTEALFPASEF